MAHVPGALTVITLALFVSPHAAPQAIFTSSGTEEGGAYGQDVSICGDVDGDGILDLAIGAHLVNGTAGSDAGRVEIRSGIDFSSLFAVEGNGFHDRFGFAIDGAGDVDGDGRADLLVGAPQSNLGPDAGGYAAVVSGATGGVIRLVFGDQPDDELGWSVAGVGDVDNDGFPDIAAGARSAAIGGQEEAGWVRVYAGATGAILHQFSGSEPDQWLGWSLAGPGDVDLDGWADVLAGLPGADTATFARAGKARLYSGASGAVLFEFEGHSSFDVFGIAVDGAGDIDGDGVVDLIIGADQDDTNGTQSGAARVYSGTSGTVLLTVFGEAANNNFGDAVAGIGDTDGDGRDDVVVGAHASDAMAATAGQVRLVSGATGTILREWRGQGDDDHFGRAIDAGGDVNQDGYGDVLIGAPETSGDPGYVELQSSRCGSAVAYGAGCPGTGGFVPTLSLSGCFTRAGTVTVTIAGGLGLESTGNPLSIALLFAGTQTAALPVAGGCLLQVQPALLVAPPMPLIGRGAGNGNISLSAMLSHHAPLGIVHIQAFTQDIGVEWGSTATNGVTVTIE